MVKEINDKWNRWMLGVDAPPKTKMLVRDQLGESPVNSQELFWFLYEAMWDWCDAK